VAVVPGYVKCPKCGAPLPKKPARLQTNTAGGTSVESGGGFPVVPVVGAGLVLAIVIAVFALRGGDDKKQAPTATPTAAAPDAGGGTTATGAADPDPIPDPPTQDQDTTADPSAATRALGNGLQRERLWGTVETIGTRIEIRSGACDDPKMATLIEASTPALRDGGLTKLRCLEQSGRVVFERDL
jgi:hypothetical protein